MDSILVHNSYACPQANGKSMPNGDKTFTIKDEKTGKATLLYKSEKDGKYYHANTYSQPNPKLFINDKPTMLGANGTQLPSTTIWRNGPTARIDVENPAPGKRAGQIHYQAKNNNKYYYNPADDKLYVGKTSNGIVAPKSMQKLLLNPDFRKGIEKGLKYLGEK